MAAFTGTSNVARTEPRLATDANRTGLTLGLLMGGFHTMWALLVAAGWAQPLVDFIFWVHFIRPVYVVDRFEPVRALLLIALTAAIGYGIGASFALLWNRVRR